MIIRGNALSKIGYLGLTEGIYIENQEELVMHQVKIKFFDRSITFPSNSRLLWINADFDVTVQDVDQPAFIYLSSPSHFTHDCVTWMHK